MKVLTVKMTHSYYNFRTSEVIIQFELPMKYGYQQVYIKYTQEEKDTKQLQKLGDILGAQRLVREFDKKRLRTIITIDKDNKVIPLAFGYLKEDKFFIHNGNGKWITETEALEVLKN